MKNKVLSFFDSEPKVIVFVTVIVIAFAMLQNCDWQIGKAKAANRRPAWDEPTELDLGKCLIAESDTFVRDWPLISHCLLKQWKRQPYGRTFRGQIRAHCAVFHRGGRRYYHSRPRAIRASTWEKPLHKKPDDWRRLRRFVDRFQAGKVADPCPRCIWWFGRTDVRKPHLTCPIGPIEVGGRKRGNTFCYVQP